MPILHQQHAQPERKLTRLPSRRRSPLEVILHDYGSRRFYGKSRGLLVDGLLSLYIDVAKSCEPALVSLEAPQGWGKTRAGREFYARIAESPSDERYWPESIEDPRQGRKAVRPPDVDRAANSLPEFFWWGISCSAPHGEPMLRAHRVQLEDHALYLAARCMDLESGTGWIWLGQARRALRALAEEGAQEAASTALGYVLQEAVPVVGTGVRSLIWLSKELKDRRHVRREIEQPGMRNRENESFVDETFRQVTGLCRLGLPFVILVEDVHEADDDSLKLIERLLKVKLPLLVVTTTLPDKVENSDRLSCLLVEARRVCRVYRVRHRVHRDRHDSQNGHGEPADSLFPDGAGFSELPVSARKEIVQGYFSAIRVDTLKVLTDKYSSPLALEMACELLEDEAKDGSDIDPEDASKLPEVLRLLYYEFWSRLPEAVGVALSVAHVITPASIDRDHTNGSATQTVPSDSQGRERSGTDNVWTYTMLEDVIECLDLRKPERKNEVLAEIRSAPHAYSWVRIIDDYLRSFAERTHDEIAEELGPGLLIDKLKPKPKDPESARRQVLTSLADVVGTRSQEPTSSAAINRARTVVALHARGYLTNNQSDLVAEAIDLLLRQLVGRDMDDAADTEKLEPFLFPHRRYWHYSPIARISTTLEYGTVLANVRSLYRAFNSMDHQRLLAKTRHAIRASVAQAYIDMYEFYSPVLQIDRLQESFEVAEAVDAINSLLADQLDVLGGENPDTLRTRWTLASFLDKRCQLDEAAREYKAMVEACTQARSALEATTDSIRRRLCEVLLQAEKYEEAVAENKTLLKDLSDRYGEDHDWISGIQLNVARALEGLGRLEESAEIYTALYGADPYEAIQVRYAGALRLEKDGRIEDSILAYQEKLVHQNRSLGTDYKYTRFTRHQLVRLLGGAGRFDEAITEFEGLLNDCLRTVRMEGSGVTLWGDASARARLEFESAVGVDSRRVEADACRTLLEDRVRTLDRDHIIDLADFWLACGSGMLAREGMDRAAKARSAFETLRDRRLGSLEADYPGVHTAKRGIAFCFGMAGRADDAVTSYRELLDDMLQVHDPTHPDILAIRHSLARWSGMAGLADDAIDSYRGLLDDMLQVHDLTHPDILATLHSLAGCLNTTDHRDDAVTSGRKLLEARLNALGTDHPDTLDARSNLAACLYRADQFGDAATEGLALHGAQQRLGANRDVTEITRIFVEWICSDE